MRWLPVILEVLNFKVVQILHIWRLLENLQAVSIHEDEIMHDPLLTHSDFENFSWVLQWLK